LEGRKGGRKDYSSKEERNIKGRKEGRNIKGRTLKDGR
jgi:hypothetical protein